MYFLFIFVIIITATVIHVVSQFKKKAELTGEAKLSITAKNILPASRTCKICAIGTFIGMVITGLIMLIEGNTFGKDWNLLQLSEGEWIEIHLILTALFVVVFGLHLYTHSYWLKKKLSRK
ncbi:MAG: DUF4405 domain-containing protein [Ignavibacteria bacterium]